LRIVVAVVVMVVVWS